MYKFVFLSTLFLAAFEGSQSCANDEKIEVAKPKINCIDMAKEVGHEWRTFTLPHMSDCRKFYGCLGSGELVEMQCADIINTRYDPFHYICEWNSNIECITYNDFIQLNKTHFCE